MEIELFDLVFNSRKNDDVTYNEFGEIKYINNVSEIGSEFITLEAIINKIAERMNLSTETVYQNMIDSYEKHDILTIEARRNYVLGMSYARDMEEYNEPISQISEEELGCIINQKWNEFLEMSEFLNFHEDLINDYTFLGIDDTIREYYGFGENQIIK